MTFYSDSMTSDFCPDTSIGYLSRRVYQLAVGHLDQVFAPVGITMIQWSALVSIHFDRGNTCAELARDIAYDKGATTRLVDVLEGRGWVTRRRHATDRRVINLALTDDGEEITQRCKSLVVDLWNGWLSDWKEEEVMQLITLLQRLRTTLQHAPIDKAFA